MIVMRTVTGFKVYGIVINTCNKRIIYDTHRLDSRKVIR